MTCVECMVIRANQMKELFCENKENCKEAYQQGRADAIEEFARAFERVKLIGCNGCKHLDDDVYCWDCVAEQLKEQK